jgi:hypothetical protein
MNDINLKSLISRNLFDITRIVGDYVVGRGATREAAAQAELRLPAQGLQTIATAVLESSKESVPFSPEGENPLLS